MAVIEGFKNDHCWKKLLGGKNQERFGIRRVAETLVSSMRWQILIEGTTLLS